MTSLSPVPVEPLFGRPRDLCPEVTFFMCIYMSDFVQIGLWESGQKRGTDGRLDIRTEIRTTISASRWPQIKIMKIKFEINVPLPLNTAQQPH